MLGEAQGERSPGKDQLRGPALSCRVPGACVLQSPPGSGHQDAGEASQVGSGDWKTSADTPVM